MKIIKYIILLIVVYSCATTKEITSYKEITVRDTIRTTDTLKIVKIIKGETIHKIDTIIDIKKVLVNGKINISPLFAYGKFSDANAGVIDNKPYLNLNEHNISIDTVVYIDRINILEKKLIEKNSDIEKISNKWFFQDVWFWLFVITVLLLFLSIRFKRFI